MSGAVDFFPTPAWCADEGARLAGQYGWWPGAGRRVVDPCAGTGALLDAMVRLKEPLVTLFGLELDGELAAQSAVPVNVEDALAGPDWPACNVVLMNPPFSRAQEFVERAMAQAPVVVALLRLGFMASQVRKRFYAGPLPDVHVLAKRPSFSAKGKADTSDYAWFVWSPMSVGRWDRIEAKS